MNFTAISLVFQGCKNFRDNFMPTIIGAVGRWDGRAMGCAVGPWGVATVVKRGDVGEAHWSATRFRSETHAILERFAYPQVDTNMGE